MTPAEAMDRIAAEGDLDRAKMMEAYHKVARPYLGVPLPVLNEVAKEWRQTLPLEDRIALARGLWDTNVFEGRVTAGKLLTQARIRPDGAVWQTIAGWVPEFDSWAIADHASKAGERRLVADPSRLDEVETWLDSDHMWAQRAALVMTLPWTKQRDPKPDEEAVRERVLGWAVRLSGSREWFLHKAIAWWLRELSKHAPSRVQAFLDRNGDKLKPFARREAAKYLG